MKFTIEKKAFAAALAHVTRVVERRNTYPILANVLIDAAGGGITLRATDLDIEVTETVPAIVLEPGKTTVPAQTLNDIVRKVADGAEIAFEEKEQNATLKAGRSRFSLMCLSDDSFPSMKSGTYSHRFEMPAAELASLMKRAEFCISNEETRYYLNGIFFHHADNDAGRPVLRAVATDGHRLARIDCEPPEGCAGMPSVIVPKKTVAELIKLLGAGTAPVAIEVSDTKIRFAFGDVVLVSKLIEGTFPDYRRVIPALSNTIADIDVGALRTTIDRVSVMASERGGKAVKFALSSGNLELSVTNSDHGTSVEDLEAGWEGDALEIGFNARYAMDVLAAVSGEKVRISLADPGAPTRFFSEDDPTAMFVLMPMRV